VHTTSKCKGQLLSKLRPPSCQCLNNELSNHIRWISELSIISLTMNRTYSNRLYLAKKEQQLQLPLLVSYKLILKKFHRVIIKTGKNMLKINNQSMEEYSRNLLRKNYQSKLPTMQCSISSLRDPPCSPYPLRMNQISPILFKKEVKIRDGAGTTINLRRKPLHNRFKSQFS